MVLWEGHCRYLDMAYLHSMWEVLQTAFIGACMTKNNLREGVVNRLIELSLPFTDIEHGQIQESCRLFDDLHFDGDEFSFYFAPLVEETFSIKISNSSWSKVSTLSDIVDIVLNS